MDFSKVKTVSIHTRYSKVTLADFAKPVQKDATLNDYIQSLPAILAANDINAIAEKIILAKKSKKEIIWAMGSHVLKVGLSPIIIDLMKNGFVTGLAFNGSSLIHDFEVAYCGMTSEEVAVGLKDGSFGVTQETTEFLNSSIRDGHKNKWGLGFAVGKKIESENLKFKDTSLFYNAVKLGIPATVHVAIGTDIFHMHPECDGEKLGGLTHCDFKILTERVGNLSNGVFLNIGSNVIIPEVFMKALNLARNVGCDVSGFTTANFDFIRHYRPTVNVVQRPTEGSGNGYYIIGHHELSIPLLAAILKTKS